jgi:hypothetical protein
MSGSSGYTPSKMFRELTYVFIIGAEADTMLILAPDRTVKGDLMTMTDMESLPALTSMLRVFLLTG